MNLSHNRTLVFLAPFGALPIYIFPLVAMAKRLRDSGYNILWIKCFSAMNGACPVHYTLNCDDNSQKRQQVCSWCISYQNDVLDKLGFDGGVLYHHDPEDQYLNDAQLRNTVAYQLILKHNCTNMEQLEQNHSSDLNRYEQTCSGLITQLDNLGSKIDLSQAQIIALHVLYPVSAVIVNWASKRGIPWACFNLSYSIQYLDSAITLSRTDNQNALIQLSRFYEQNWRSIRFSEDDLKRYLEDVSGALEKRHLKHHSLGKGESAKSIKQKLGIEHSHQKIIIVFLSSTDETAGSEVALRFKSGELPGSIFANQSEWVRSLIQRYANQPGVLLIIRPHPRELIYKSLTHLDWILNLKGVYPNVLISDQSIPMSSFDLFDIADVCLVSLSTAGLEALSLGIPTVSIWPSIVPWAIPLKFSQARNVEEYFNCVDSLINTASRDLESSEFATAYSAFYLAASHVYFEHGNYWAKNTGPNSNVDKDKKQRRVNSDMPVLDINDYLSKWTINEFEWDKVLKFFSGSQETYESHFQYSIQESLPYSARDTAIHHRAMWQKYINEDEKTSSHNKSLQFFNQIAANECR